MTGKPYRIMVIDDDRTMRDSLTHLLETAGFSVTCLPRAENVLARLHEADTDVLLSDVRMPGLSGTDLQDQLKDQCSVPVVLMSAHGDIPMAVSAIHNGAYSFLEKPFDPRRLISLLKNAGQLHRTTRLAERLKGRLAELSGLDRVMIGNTEGIRQLRVDVLDLASTMANVLLVGETGTGKELVARALHDLGPRAAEPFVAVNCAAIPVSRFEDVLFGDAEGSSGLLARAEGGTLFIDELGAIPAEIQAKLLRVIETRQYTPANSARDHEANIRIVSAAQDTLQACIGEGRFREDLYFRLNTITLTLPPLRERKDDIPLLYVHYLDLFARTYEVQVPQLTSADMATLMAHEWRGNVRELRNVCERHVLAVRRGSLAHSGSVEGALHPGRDGADMPETLREAVAAFERQLIGKALLAHAGRMEDVAAALGIGRRTLNEKIVKLGLDKDEILNA